jgi:adenylate cyclase class 2
MAIEIEKKYRITEAEREEIIASLEEFGAVFEGERFEENILFGNDEMLAKKSVLRLRRTDEGSYITFKQRIESVSEAKQQIEFESRVDDADAVRSIVESIGLTAVIVYEKRRKIYKFRSVELVIDELPFGLFMEIEGSLTAIAEAEMLLGIEDMEVEHETYPRLTAKFGKREGDLIVARFDG